jgi:TrwC relaxase
MAVMNLAQRADEADAKWRTLHSQMLYQERLAVAAYAARELASRLTDLGYHLLRRHPLLEQHVAGALSQGLTVSQVRSAIKMAEFVQQHAAEVTATNGSLLIREI